MTFNQLTPEDTSQKDSSRHSPSVNEAVLNLRSLLNLPNSDRRSPSNLTNDPVAPSHQNPTPSVGNADSIENPSLLDPPLDPATNPGFATGGNVDPADSSSPSSNVGSRRFHSYLHPEFPPEDEAEFTSSLARISSTPPVDWCDSFVNPFHLEISRDPKKWKLLFSSFFHLEDLDSLHTWLATKTKSNAIALLGCSRGGDPLLIHNLMVNPSSGSITHPSLEFLAVDRCSFDCPPFSIPNDDLEELLPSSQKKRVATFSEILKHCVIPVPSSDEDLSCFRFKFCPHRFLDMHASQFPDDADHTFDYGHLALLPPFVSGSLTEFLDPSSKTPEEFFPFPIDTETPLVASTCAFLFHQVLIRWLISNPPLTEIARGIPHDHEFFLPLQDVFRFLWILHHRSHLLHPLVPSRPKNFTDASLAFLSLKKANFPTVCFSPPRFARSVSAPPSLPPGSSRSSAFRAPPQEPSTFPNPFSSASSQNGKVQTTDSEGNIIFVSPEFVMMRDTFSSLQKKPKDDDDICSPDSKSLFRDIARVFQNNLRYATISPLTGALPSDLSPIIKKLWKLKNTTTFYETLMAEVFSPMDNPCSLIFGQVPIIQRYGIRWKNEACSGGFSPFSFDPHAIPGLDNANALDRGIRQKIHEASIHHINDFKTVDLQGIYSDHHLHFPRLDTEFEAQLRSFWCLIKGLFGDQCFLALQTLRVLNHYYRNKSLYIGNHQTCSDGRFFAQVLYMIDRGLQRFIAQLNDPQEFSTINFKDTESHFDYIIFAVENNIPLGRLSNYLEAKFEDQHGSSRDKKRPLPSDTLVDSSNKRHDSKRDPHDSRSRQVVTPATYNSPDEWKLPSHLNYRDVFTREVLANIPTVTKNGKQVAFCNLLFSKGECKKGKRCPFAHDDPAAQNKKTAMSEFYRSAYGL